MAGASQEETALLSADPESENDNVHTAIVGKFSTNTQKHTDHSHNTNDQSAESSPLKHQSGTLNRRYSSVRSVSSATGHSGYTRRLRYCNNRVMHLPKPGARLLIAIILVAFGVSTPFGYFLTVINVPQEIFEQFVNESFKFEHNTYLGEASLKSLWSVIVSSFTLGGAFGGLIAAPSADRLGRKNSLLIIAVVTTVGAGLSSASAIFWSFEIFTLGRILMGIASGFGSCLLCIYLSEISPIQLRGFAGGFQEVFIVTGKLLGVLLSLPAVWGTRDSWPYLVGAPCVCTVLMLITLPFFPETPKHLRARNRRGTQVHQAIRFYHGLKADTSEVLLHIDKEIELLQTQVSFTDVLRSPMFRKSFTVAVVIRAAQELTGVTVIANFSTGLFETLRFSPSFAQYNTVGITALSVLVTIISACCVERLGRRPMLIYGLIGTLVCDVLFMLSALCVDYLDWYWAGYISIFMFYMHVVVFGLGPGPIGWLIVPELCPQSARSVVTSSGVCVNWLANLLTTAVYLPLTAAVGHFALLLFIVPLSVCIVYLHLVLPETKGRPIEDIMQDLVRGRHRHTQAQTTVDT